MRLKQLKLAGFKSFVDPTVVDFPSQLVAVLGPNGCGKSNIIDAVRWVLGESSAKNLRGESMADVIFNGSSNRKSLGQASVELIFDNSLGRLAGPFASYGEISIRRVVTRDGESTYYFNGSRCRRKDVTDFFLGTGAGARSYSIIGQGTISRLIEAKPEELRAFLEEAAGVSKYKERRRETLQRIEQTRDNLLRVADIREELDKQLQRLERQAKAAERYTALKEEEQRCRAEILALKWQDYTSQQAIKQRELQEAAIQYEHLQSQLTGATKDRTVLNEKLHDTNEQMQQIQASFYQLGTDIARLEETIQQQDREKKRLENDRQQMQSDWQIATDRLKQDEMDLQSGQETSRALATQLDSLQLEFKNHEIQWQDAREQQTQWEQQWQDRQVASNAVKRDLQVAQVSLQHINQRRQQTAVALEKIHANQQSVSLLELQAEKVALSTQQDVLQTTQTLDAQQYEQGQALSQQLQAQLKVKEQQLHQLQDEFYRVNTELAALSAAQKAAGKSTGEGVVAWADKSKLMKVLQVEPLWQSVCEMVLGDSLQAYVLEAFDELWPQWDACTSLGGSVVTWRKATTTHKAYPLLIDKINGDIPATAQQLETIFAATTLDEALQWLPEIQDHESIVIPQGIWLGRGWVKLTRPAAEDEMGVLAREERVNALTQIVQETQEQLDQLRVARDLNHTQLQQAIADNTLLQATLQASNEALRVNANALHAKEQAIIHTEQQQASLVEEYNTLQLLVEELTAEALQLTKSIQQLESQLEETSLKELQSNEEKHTRQHTLTALAQQKDNLRGLVHQKELEHDRELTKVQQLTDRIARDTEQLGVLQERLEQLAQQSMQFTAPENNAQDQLAELVLKHSEVETQLTISREQVTQIRMALETLEKQISQHDLAVKSIQDNIAQIRMDEQALAVRASAVQESLDELVLQAPVLLAQLAVGITQSDREDALLAIAEKIKRLGAINLAAIEEFAAEQQRKLYLDEQFDDLAQALATLETAINKMDNETRTRLENTFDEVNTSFKALFPRLFGGGRAQLELTCDNMLEAGIVVMAQPPGKRNSTIHLLSGGEKAMTAVALVFAIFQLNPSPFCMLDEVDAPLDDVNVGRFCALVKEMSQLVQFLFITHNKVTMELADHLIGVTMREPGVSRLVTVDVKQALTTE